MIYDISPPITHDLKVWPGDTPPTREVLCDLASGDNITLSTVHTTVHVGAHADAPSHYAAGTPSIEQRPLDIYIGPCQVMHVATEPNHRITPKELPDRVRAARILLGTGTYADPTVFDETFAAMAPELVDFLHEEGVILAGIDTPSVDLFDSKDLPTHQRFRAHGMAILEGLVLTAVPDGLYELVALPLPLVGFDASPVRAILRGNDRMP